MPNRIIKESICTSEKLAALSDFEFRLWVGLITQVDDAGRGDARPAVVKGRVFPFRDRLTIKDVDAALHGLADKGCISLYNVGGKSYFYFPSWTEHQRIRDCKPKFPEPNDDNLRQSAASCGELPQSAASCGLNPIQSESQSESESESKTRAFDAFWSAYPKKAAKKDAERAWNKIKPASYAAIFDGLERAKTSEQWKKDGGKYIPYPATWLNGERWNDEQSESNLQMLARIFEGE